MPRINSLGLGSGVLNGGILEKLRASDESANIAPLDEKIAKNIEKKKELVDVTTKVSALKNPVSGLADYSTYIARKALSSSDAITANVTPGVPVQEIELEVKSLASNDINEVGKKFGSLDDVFSERDVRLNLFSNGKHYDVKITAGMTLSAVAQEITDKSRGEIIGLPLKVGGEKPYQLVINSKHTGEKGRIYFGSTIATRQVKAIPELKEGDFTVVVKDKFLAEHTLDIKIPHEDVNKKNKTEVLHDAIKRALAEDPDLDTLIANDVLSVGLSKDHDSIILNDRRGHEIEFAGRKLEEFGLENTKSNLSELFTTSKIPEGALSGHFTIGTIPFNLEEITAEGNSSEENARIIARAIENISGLHAVADRNGKIHLSSEIGEVGVSSQDPEGREFLEKIGLKDGIFKDYLALQQEIFNFKKLSEGKDAKIILNGKEIARDTNRINDVINGVDITLNHTTEKPISLKISHDKEAITSKITEFVTTYNDLVTSLTEKTRYDVDTGVAGIFNGESDIRDIRPRLNSLLTQSIFDKKNSSKSLVDFGLSLNEKSALTFDSSKLSAALDADPENVTEIFYGYDKKTSTNRDSHTDGAFRKLDNFLQDLGSGAKSRLEVFDASLSREAKNLQKERRAASERLDARYEQMTRQFSAYDEQISRANTAFGSVQMMIDQSTAKKS